MIKVSDFLEVIENYTSKTFINVYTENNIRMYIQISVLLEKYSDYILESYNIDKNTMRIKRK